MKYLFLLLVLGVLGGAIYYGNQMRQGYRACNELYQDSLDTIAIQARTVFGERRGSCIASLGVLNDWTACVDRAEKPIYGLVRPMLRPIVSNVMMFFREKTKDIDVLKREHDERCKEYSELLYFSPEE